MTPHGRPHIGNPTLATPHHISEAHLQEMMKKSDFSLGIEGGDPDAIITFSPPAVIHQVLGLLPAVLTIPPDINPPPAVPLQQGANAALSAHNFSTWLDELTVGATNWTGLESRSAV